MINFYYSYTLGDLDDELKKAIEVFSKNQATAWQTLWKSLNSSEPQTAFINQSGAVLNYQAEKIASRDHNKSVRTRHRSDAWDQYDEDLKQSLGNRASIQAAFRHCLWDVMSSDEPKESCFFGCCCEGSGYRITEKKAA